jgi:hypothetical protein
MDGENRDAPQVLVFRRALEQAQLEGPVVPVVFGNTRKGAGAFEEIIRVANDDPSLGVDALQEQFPEVTEAHVRKAIQTAKKRKENAAKKGLLDDDPDWMQ